MLIYVNTVSGCLLLYTEAKEVKTAIIQLQQYFLLTQWVYN